MGSHAFSGRAPIRKPCGDDIIRHDMVREIRERFTSKFKQMSFLGRQTGNDDSNEESLFQNTSIIHRKHYVALLMIRHN